MNKKQPQNSSPFRKHIALTIAMFSLLPCLVLSGVFYKALKPQWIHSALEKQYTSLEYSSLSLSGSIIEMNQKMQYILLDTTIRPYITQIDDLSLIHQLDLLQKLDETASALTVDNHALSIRWYPYYCQKSYGSSCIPLETLAHEFEIQDNSMELEHIMSLTDGKAYWTVRHISRGINNNGTVEERLCLYTQFSSSRNPNCVLELTIPISALYNHNDYEQIENSMLVFCQNSKTDFWNIVLNTSLSSEQVTSLLDVWRLEETCPGYHVLSNEVPNVSNGTALLFIPNSHVQALLLPYLLTYFGIILLVVTLIVAAGYFASYILSRRVITLIDKINNNLDSYFCDTVQRSLDSEGLANISSRIEQLILNTQMYCNQVEYYESENARMELELLQMRFNPHLLYNTLSTLKYHIADPIFRQTIDSLCKYYRIILNNGHLLIRMKDELEMIRQYADALNGLFRNHIAKPDRFREQPILSFGQVGAQLAPQQNRGMNIGKPAGIDSFAFTKVALIHGNVDIAILIPYISGTVEPCLPLGQHSGFRPAFTIVIRIHG